MSVLRGYVEQVTGCRGGYSFGARVPEFGGGQ